MARITYIVVSCFVSLGITKQASPYQIPTAPAPSATLIEQFNQSTVVVLVTWQSFQIPSDDNTGETLYEVSKIVKAPKGAIRKGDRIALPRYRSGKKGGLYLLFGKQAVKIKWEHTLESTDAIFEYITQAPSSKDSRAKRLSYFMKHLESPDPVVANDAFAEFVNAPYKDLYAIRIRLPREKLRKWVSSSETSLVRLGHYGMLLGLCGNASDEKMLEKKILESPNGDEFRLGIDGVMAGYLLLGGEEALKVLEETKLKNKKAPFGDTFAVMMALRFLWTFEPDRILKERMKQAMRILLDRAELADLVIADLSRWEDWSSQDRLMKIYENKEYDIPAVKRAIIRYMLACSHSHESQFGDPPEYVEKARTNLAVLRWENPKLYETVERYYYVFD